MKNPSRIVSYIFVCFFVVFCDLSATTLVLIGLPGSGKGTLARRLTDEHNFVSFSTGDLVRKEIFKKTPLGLSIKSTVAKNELIDDEIVHLLLKKNLLEALEEKQNIIIDGFPRSQKSFEFLLDFLEKTAQINKTLFVKVGCPEDTCLKRITERIVCPQCSTIYNLEYVKPKKAYTCDDCKHPLIKRSNDSIEIATKRIEQYKKDVLPFFYKGKQMFPSITIKTDNLEKANLGYDKLIKLIKEI